MIRLRGSAGRVVALLAAVTCVSWVATGGSSAHADVQPVASTTADPVQAAACAAPTTSTTSTPSTTTGVDSGSTTTSTTSTTSTTVVPPSTTTTTSSTTVPGGDATTSTSAAGTDPGAPAGTSTTDPSQSPEAAGCTSGATPGPYPVPGVASPPTTTPAANPADPAPSVQADATGQQGGGALDPQASDSSRKPSIPTGNQAYLGAFLDPNGVGLSAKKSSLALSGAEVLRQLPTFNQGPGSGPGLGRRLSIVQIEEGWSETPDTTLLQQIFAAGATPMINWECGTTDHSILTGIADPQISSMAQTLAEFGRPVFLNWFADANAPGPAPNRDTCLNDLGPIGAAQYQEAFAHIRNAFVSAGATNVAFVWTALATDPGPLGWTNYYPGNRYVDWIGADGYDDPAVVGRPISPQTAFGAWYQKFSTSDYGGRPLMISDTGASPDEQQSYLEQLPGLVTSSPGIGAVNYLDYYDYTDCQSEKKKAPPPLFGTCTNFDLRPQQGYQAFATISSNPVFLPDRRDPVVGLGSSNRSVAIGQPIKLVATVAKSDLGGTVSFTDGSTPVTGCDRVPVFRAGECDTSLPAGGHHVFHVVYSGDAQTNPGASGYVAVDVAPGAQAPQLPAIPQVGSAYLGGWVQPEGQLQATTSAKVADEVALLPDLNAQLTRPLSVVHVYETWTGGAVPNYELQQVMASGAIPIVDWECGDTDANVVAGADDALITSFATQLASLHSPVFLRWFWEPNFVGSPTVSRCVYTDGPAGYAAAFRHIHDVFRQAGASNVAFVWAMGAAGSPDMFPYYPGSSYVDWIAEDGYDRGNRHGKTGLSPQIVSDLFGQWYSDFSVFGKPMMISETGAVPGFQPFYLDRIRSAVAGTDPSGPKLPLIRGVMYFDAKGGNFKYNLKPKGLEAFKSLDASSVFQPARFPTSISPVTVQSAYQGALTTLQATVGMTDGGGNVSFFADGSTTPVRGCDSIPAAPTASCSTNSLDPGRHLVEARYSGDSAFQLSRTAKTRVVVSPPKQPGGAAPPTIPGPDNAYLGAYVNPKGVEHAGANPADLATFQASLAHPVSILQLPQAWDAPVSTAVLASIRSAGAIPMVNWACGDTDANVIAGADDTLISTFAWSLAALKAPVFLSWFPDASVTSPEAGKCLDVLGQAGYIQAYQHISTLFAEAGATNVAFVWTGALGQPVDNYLTYFPGPKNVDWVAAENLVDLSTAHPNNRIPRIDAGVALLGPWYKSVKGLDKPLMIADLATSAGDQGLFLDGAFKKVTTDLHRVKAVIYYDAPGSSKGLALDAAGLAHFSVMSADPYFRLPIAPTSVSLAATGTSTQVDQPVTVQAAVQNSDGGGAVTFYQAGAPIPSCQDEPILSTPTCTVVPSATGTITVTASYSGDVNYGPSQASPVAIEVFEPVAFTPSALVPIAGPPPAALTTPPTPVPAVISPAIPFEVGLPAESPAQASPFVPAPTTGPGRSPGSGLLPIAFTAGAGLIAYVAIGWARDRRRMARWRAER